MRLKSIAFAIAASFALAGAAGAAVFTTSASFVAAIQPGSYLNAFTGLAAGPSPIAGINYASGGFAYNIKASTDVLYNDPGVVSTNLATDQIIITFTGTTPVTAVGGNFWSTDINVVPVTATVTAMLSTGVTETFTSTSAADFRGFTSALPIVSLTIDAVDPSTSVPAWPTLDNLRVGTAVVPEPATLAAIAGAGLVAFRRRRA